MKLRTNLRLPTEHGAWAMVYVPFVVGAIVGAQFTLRVAALFAAITFMFIARESLLVWWRARSRGQLNRGAWQMMVIYLSLAAIAGVPLVLIAQLYWLTLLGLATGLLLLLNAKQALRREDRTIGGEIIAILGMTLTAPAAYYVARGVWDKTAWWLWALCALYFTSSVFYVKLRVYSMNKRKAAARRQSQLLCARYHAFLLTALITVAVTGSLNLFALVAFAPVLARSFWQLAKPAPDLDLLRIGVSEIIYSMVFLIFITMTFRLA